VKLHLPRQHAITGHLSANSLHCWSWDRSPEQETSISIPSTISVLASGWSSAGTFTWTGRPVLPREATASCRRPALIFTVIGAVSGATLGWFDPRRKMYKKIPINGQYEVIGMSGDIALFWGIR
jgi:hypothetical protein